jgi:hypothetical protein
MEEKGLMEILTSAEKVNVKNLDDVLGTISKYERILDKFLSLYGRLEKSGVINAVLRIAGKRSGVDLDKPTIHPLSVVASTPQHKVLFDLLNSLAPQDVQNMYFAILQQMSVKNKIQNEVNENERKDERNKEDKSTE